MPAALPPAWIQHGLVILAGAGLSVAPPANVVSWWTFNDGILRGLRQQSLSVITSEEGRRAVDSLSLESLDLVAFSQTVSDAFASGSWFDLLQVLQAEEPNDGHAAIADLAQQGVVRVVVTTNFDGLVEHALRKIQVSYSVLNPLVDAPPPVLAPEDVVVVVKLHGSLDSTRSLVDLARQKTRGFSDTWTRWLTYVFSTHATCVVGFSGLDLRVENFGLQNAAPMVPDLRWLCLPDQPLSQPAQQVLRVSGDRGHVVEGTLPSYLVDFTEIRPTTRVGKSGHDRLRLAVAEWLNKPYCDPLSCAVGVLFLLRINDPDGAEAVAADVRRRAGMLLLTSRDDPLTLARVCMAFSGIGAYGLAENDPQAEEDLRRGAELGLHLLDLAHRGQIIPAHLDELTMSTTATLLNLGRLLTQTFR